MFVRTRDPTDDPTKVVVQKGADTSDLKEAVAVKLQLTCPMHRVSLDWEDVSGQRKHLSGSGGDLFHQGVRPGDSIIVRVLEPPSPPLSSHFNVIAQGPMAALDAGQLGTLVDPHTQPSQRIAAFSLLLEALSPQVPHLRHNLPLFDTEAHATLLSLLVDHAHCLCAGVYEGVIDAGCSTLVGAGGIGETGKTAVLRAFSTLAASAFPTLIPLYISGLGLTRPGHALHTAHLQALIARALRERGVAVGGAGGAQDGGGGQGGNDDAIAALTASNMNLLLIMDEFDELFKAPAIMPELVRNVLASLGELSYLGDQRSGRIGVMLCGSSLSPTFRLVSEDTKHLLDKFPHF